MAISRHLGLDVTGAGEGPGGRSLALGLAYWTRVAAWGTSLGLWDALPARTRSGNADLCAGRHTGSSLPPIRVVEYDLVNATDAHIATDLYSIHTRHAPTAV